MATVKQAQQRQLISRIIWLAAIILIGLFLSILNGPKVGSIFEGLTPPDLPPVIKASKRVWFEQNWDQTVSDKYHHISQGTRTLPF